jgi:membrane-bound lytic murein transglycosylase B
MKINNSSLLAIFSLSVFLAYTKPCSAIENTPLLQSFIQRMVKKHHFDAVKLTVLFKSATLKKDILNAISKPAEAHTPWYKYRKWFLTEARITTGVKFWQENQKVLTEISQKYGVPAEIIVAIIGVETFYGKDTGSYRVIDALSTLGFFYPKRSQFFLTELENFLLLCKEENLNPLIPVGSYAGAMGLAQFMPSSIRTYAVDYDRDKHRDMLHNRFDVMASIANYLVKYGWEREQAVAYPVSVKGNQYQRALDSKKLEPNLTLAQLQKLNIALPPKVDLRLKARLLSFEQEKSASLWLGLNNFYVITRYNRSALYAMAVYQLSAAILAKKGLTYE